MYHIWPFGHSTESSDIFQTFMTSSLVADFDQGGTEVGAIALSYPLFLFLMAYHEETWLNANTRPNPNPIRGDMNYESAVLAPIKTSDVCEG